MKLELTLEQLQTLVHCVHWGTWVANATKLAEDRVAEVDALRQLVYRAAHQQGMASVIEFDQDNELYLLEEAYEETLQTTVDEYDEEIAWDFLATELARRDWVQKNPGKARKTDSAASQEQVSGILREKERWEKEWEDWGVERLRVVH